MAWQREGAPRPEPPPRNRAAAAPLARRDDGEQIRQQQRRRIYHSLSDLHKLLDELNRPIAPSDDGEGRP